MQSVALVTVVTALAACSAAGDPSPSPPPAASFTLRAWTTQALPPAASFAAGPVIAIADGLVVTAGPVPAIYPGPLVTQLVARPVADEGIARILADMQAAGLLGERTDFTDRMLVGAPLGHVLVSLEGASREITGDPSGLSGCVPPACVPPPGTPEAFAALWTRFYDLGAWLGSALGPEQRFVADRAAILITEPTVDPEFSGRVVEWPLAKAFADTGVAFTGMAGARCVVVEGDELDTLRPAVEGANQLTRFQDRAGIERGLVVRWLMPDEPDPCRP